MKNTKLNVNEVNCEQLGLSKNYDTDQFMSMFLYHNKDFFQKLINGGYTKFPDDVECSGECGIYYEKGPWKWGSQGMQNKMQKNGFIVPSKTHNNTGDSSLWATPKLINKILTKLNSI